MTAATVKPRAVKTPGEPTPMTAAGETDADALTAQAGDLDDGGGAEPVLQITQSELQAAIARGIRDHQAALREATGPKDPDAGLPDQSEIDPDSITTPTLSKQGYVVPRHYGVPAAALKA